MTRKILLADDSVTIRKVVELTFMEEDYELEAVVDGRDALTSLDANSPDLLIADIHMPEVGGLDVAREAKKRYPELPVLLLVGTFETFDPADVTECGADGFLKKPFDSQDLLKRVALLLESSAVDEASEDEAGEAVVDEKPEAEEPVEALAEAEPASPISGPASSDSDDTSESTVDEEDSPVSPLSDADVDRIARRVAELLTGDVVREIAWEIVPDTAEIVIKERLRELESQVE